MSAAAPSAAPPLRFRVRRGLTLPLEGAPDPGRVHDGPPVTSVALLGADAPGLRAELRVEVGDRVRLGQTLFVDRRRPEIAFASPGAGVVTAIARGARRRLEAVVIRLDGEEEERFETPRGEGPPSPEALRRILLASGSWTALRTRPFERIPDPDASPHALFVTAIGSDPLAPPVEALLRERSDDFVRGVEALAQLPREMVVVCARAGAELPLPDAPGVRRAAFEGPHPAGLPGTHMHLVAPVSPERPAWHLPASEVVALGRLLATGRLDTGRVVALAGPSVVHPRLVRTRLGASTEDLVMGALRPEPCRVLSGSVLSGRQASGHGAFLGRLHAQVCVLPEEESAPGRRAWLRPGRGGHAWAVPGTGRRGIAAPGSGGRRGPFVPLARMDAVWPFDVPAAPLLRALLVGDVEAARELGALELAEEDLALLAFLCPGRIGYGDLLRSVLDEIERQGP